MSATGRERHIVVVGAMATGKTTLGRLLAERLGRPFIDSDEQLSEHHGATARTLAERSGVVELHAAEATALLRALDAGEPSVIAAAASVCDRPDLVGRLADEAFVVLLAAPAEVVGDRIAPDDHRRPIGDDDFADHVAARERGFAGIADVRVDTIDMAPADAVRHILRALR